MSAIFVPGTLTYVSETLINPYTGHELVIDGDYYVNNSVVIGEDEDDFIFGTSSDQYWRIENQNGDALIENITYFFSAPGDDIVILASEQYSLGDLLVQVSSGDDVVWAGDGNDILGGQEGDDFLHGGPGDDIITGHDGADILVGGSGVDTLDYAVSLGPVFVDLRTNSVSGGDAEGDSVEGFENVIGSDFAASGDTLHGDDASNEIQGLAGDDYINGHAGADILYGGDGNDIIFGGLGIFDVIDKDFADDIHFPGLIEGTNISNLKPPGDPSLGVNDGNLNFDFSSAAEITFRKGFAGYNNSLGVYRIAEDGTIEAASLLWENVKDAGVNQTHLIDLPFGQSGGEIGFFILSNGDRKNNYNGLETGEEGHIRFVYDYGGANERDANVSDAGADVTVIYDDGAVLKVLNGAAYHTTARGENGDLNADGAVHVVSGLADIDNDDVLRIGFEDLRLLGDADYEDVLFDLNIVETTVEISPDGDDMLYGGDGDDILVFGTGSDQATGGSGADVFAIDVLDNALDLIVDFDAGGGGDVINITEVLSGYDPLSDVISDFVIFTQSGADMIVSIDANGGGDDFVDAFVIAGGSALNAQDMYDAGSLIVDQAAVL